MYSVYIFLCFTSARFLFALSFDWSTLLSAFFVIDKSHYMYFGFGFTGLIFKSVVIVKFSSVMKCISSNHLSGQNCFVEMHILT